MSIANRIKLCDGLARKGILGKRFFKKIYPKVNYVKISTPAWFYIKGGNINDEIHLGGDEDSTDGSKDDYTITYSSPELNAGDSITMQAMVGCYGHDHHVDFEFSMSNGSTIFCQGYASQWTDKNQNTNEFIKILVPLSNGYYYTKAIAERFNIMQCNQNVGIYPHCRDW